MSRTRILDDQGNPTPFTSVYEVIGEEEYAEASDPTYSYFPCYVLEKNPETGKKDNVLDHYARHRYEED